MTARLVVPAPHKDWLYPILKPINEQVTPPPNMGKVWNHETNAFEEGDWNLLKWDMLDPRGFRFSNYNCMTMDIIVNGESKRFLYNEEVGLMSFKCEVCGHRYMNLDRFNESNKCKNCAMSLTKIGAKTDPGWDDMKKGTGPYFGIELEMVHPEGKDRMLELFNSAYKHIVEKYNWDLPAFYTDDCSLAGYGYELNFYPMGMDYFTEHEAKFIEFFTMLKNGGGSYLVGTDEKAGIHIHITKRNGHDFSNNGSFINTYARLFLNWFVHWSGRSLENFKHWNLYSNVAGEICNEYIRGHSTGYALFAKRSSDKTLEYRGYSTKRILDDPTCMKSMMRWVSVMEQASLDPKNLFLTPHQLVEKFDPTLEIPYIPEDAGNVERDIQGLMTIINSVNISTKIKKWVTACDAYFNRGSANQRSLIRFRYINPIQESEDLPLRDMYFNRNGWYYGRIREYGHCVMYLDMLLNNGELNSSYATFKLDNIEAEYVHIGTLDVRIIEGRLAPGPKPCVSDADKIITDEMCEKLSQAIANETSSYNGIVDNLIPVLPSTEQVQSVGRISNFDGTPYILPNNTNMSFRIMAPTNSNFIVGPDTLIRHFPSLSTAATISTM